MIFNQTVKSDPDLIARMTKAAKAGVTAEELHAQRVSFIASAVSDERSVVTQQMVEAQLRKLNGQAA